MKKKVDVINLTPTPEGYACALLIIIKNSQNPVDVAWAEVEIINAVKAAAALDPKAWRRATEVPK